jgi:hypothetical protein
MAAHSMYSGATWIVFLSKPPQDMAKFYVSVPLSLFDLWMLDSILI